MILPLPTARDAEQFSRALEGAAEPDVAAQYDDLVRTVARLQRRPVPQPRPEFVADLRTRLMSAAATELAATPSGVRLLGEAPRRRRERVAGAAVAAVVVIGASAGVAAASDDALPGSTLYPLKRGLEQIQVSVQRDDADLGRQYLGQAATRLAEVEGLLQTSDSATAQVTATLAQFSSRASEGGELLQRAYAAAAEPADAERLATFARESMPALERARKAAPPTLAADFADAATVLLDLDQQARLMCGDCVGRPPVTMPASLAAPAATQTLGALVSTPVTSLSRAVGTAPGQDLPPGLSKAARAAQEQAELRRDASAGQAGTPPQVLPGDTGLQAKAPLPSAKKPVTQLVGELTTGVTTSTGPLTDPLAPVLDPVTGLVTGTVSGLEGAVGGLLGSGRPTTPQR